MGVALPSFSYPSFRFGLPYFSLLFSSLTSMACIHLPRLGYRRWAFAWSQVLSKPAVQDFPAGRGGFALLLYSSYVKSCRLTSLFLATQVRPTPPPPPPPRGHPFHHPHTPPRRRDRGGYLIAFFPSRVFGEVSTPLSILFPFSFTFDPLHSPRVTSTYT